MSDARICTIRLTKGHVINNNKNNKKQPLKRKNKTQGYTSESKNIKKILLKLYEWMPFHMSKFCQLKNNYRTPILLNLHKQ